MCYYKKLICWRIIQVLFESDKFGKNQLVSECKFTGEITFESDMNNGSQFHFKFNKSNSQLMSTIYVWFYLISCCVSHKYLTADVLYIITANRKGKC